MIDGAATIWLVRGIFTVALWLLLLRAARALERSLVAPETRRGQRAVLVLVSGSAGRPGARVELAPITTFGRDPANDVVFDDEFVSGRHFTIWHDRGRWWVADERTRNGTYLNGEGLAGTAEVRDGDHIQAGRSRLALSLTS